MSPKLPVARSRDVIRIAHKLGFVLDRQKGSHAVYLRPADRARVVIPVHTGRDLKPKTLLSIVEDLGLTIEEFVEML